ncbi:CoA transferase [Saccharopolyspora sp. NPDC050642]|uniref:CaiB/BaiF CoA transferase family protein n=1 Tax=Saccharopolyspora sp. NPDC050642 TaxID=3157099 RepID=UPI0033E240F0
MSAPLKGVKVVDFGQYIAAPGAGALLAGLGADVIKVEPLGGESARNIGSFGDGMLRAYNRGKQAIALDLRHPLGRETGHRLASGADVVVQNMRPGAMERMGLGATQLRERNPALVYASVSGFGMHGPSRQRPGLDIAAQAESGIMSLTGAAGGDPQRVGLALVDAATSHALAQAILAALFRRERTGDGAEIEISLLEVAIHLQAPNFAEYFATGTIPTRRGNGQATVAPAADLIRTSDGFVVLSAYTDAHWATLCRLIERIDLLTDPRFETNEMRVANRRKLLQELGAALSARTTEDCVRWLSENGLVVGAVRNYEQVPEAADVVAAGIFARGRDADGGEETYVGLPYHFMGWTPETSAPPPALGEHSIAVLEQAGFSTDEVTALVARGIVRDGRRGSALAG